MMPCFLRSRAARLLLLYRWHSIHQSNEQDQQFQHQLLPMCASRGPASHRPQPQMPATYGPAAGEVGLCLTLLTPPPLRCNTLVVSK
ncbi:hypothetical protein HaLaN_04504, partial [Haematococcus lacustris]